MGARNVKKGDEKLVVVGGEEEEENMEELPSPFIPLGLVLEMPVIAAGLPALPSPIGQQLGKPEKELG